MKGIDVAKWNGTINWLLVKNEDADFAILKVINKSCVKEDAFERNYNGASAQGIPVDVYNYSYATTADKARSDANAVVSVIKGRKVNTVWLDVEDACQQRLGSVLVDIINAYKDVITKAGFGFGVYTGLAFYNSYIKPYAGKISCPFWIARYPVSTAMEFSNDPSESKKPVISHTLNGWQYTSNGRVNGITGAVDLNIRYDAQGNVAATNAVAQKYTVGKNYILQNNMYIRESAGGSKKKYLQLTVSAKSNGYEDAEGYGILKKGTVVTCKGIETINGAIWMKIPSGYVCAVAADGTVYIK